MRHRQAGKIPHWKEDQPACSQPIVRRKTRPKPNVRHQAAEKLRSLETPAAGIQAVAEQCDAEGFLLDLILTIAYNQFCLNLWRSDNHLKSPRD